MILEDYGVKPRTDGGGIPVASLLEKDVLLSCITQYAQYVDTASLPIACSLFIKRYAVLTAAAALDYYGFHQQKKDWLSNAYFDVSSFKLLVEEYSSEEVDLCWKTEIFANHLTPIIKLAAKICKVPEAMLWENVAVRLNSVFRSYDSSSHLQQLHALHAELCSEECDWLGLANNPFRRYLHCTFPDPENPKRKTCCRYYEVSKPGELPYCNVCPLKKSG